MSFLRKRTRQKGDETPVPAPTSTMATTGESATRAFPITEGPAYYCPNDPIFYVQLLYGTIFFTRRGAGSESLYTLALPVGEWAAPTGMAPIRLLRTEDGRLLGYWRIEPPLPASNVRSETSPVSMEGAGKAAQSTNRRLELCPTCAGAGLQSVFLPSETGAANIWATTQCATCNGTGHRWIDPES
jgi:hypothetical protein